MANGILGQETLTAITETVVYTVPADIFSVVTVNAVNRGTAARRIRLALAEADTATAAEWIEYDVEILPGGVLERTGIVLEAGRRVIAYSNATDISVSVYGMETATA
jgi:hypothetical protein